MISALKLAEHGQPESVANFSLLCAGHTFFFGNVCTYAVPENARQIFCLRNTISALVNLWKAII